MEQIQYNTQDTQSQSDRGEHDASTILNSDWEEKTLDRNLANILSVIQSKKKEKPCLKTNQRLGVIYYILDGFMDPIWSNHILQMRDVWVREDKLRFEQLKNINQFDLFQRIINTNLNYQEITKILLILSVESQQQTCEAVTEKLGYSLNLLLLEKYKQLLKKEQLSILGNNCLEGYPTTALEHLMDFYANIIWTLKNQSLHLFLPVLFDDPHEAIQIQFKMISPALATIQSLININDKTHTDSINLIIQTLVAFFKNAYPFRDGAGDCIQSQHANYFQLLIKELVQYLYLPKKFLPQDSFEEITKSIFKSLFDQNQS